MPRISIENRLYSDCFILGSICHIRSGRCSPSSRNVPYPFSYGNIESRKPSSKRRQNLWGVDTDPGGISRPLYNHASFQFLRSRSLTNLCCFRLIGSRKSYKAPPLRETLESLWNFTPTVVKEYAGDLGYVLKCLLDSDGTFCNFITAPNYVEIRFNRYICTV